MTFDIDINDAKVTNFSNLAQEELKKQIRVVADKIVDESLRIEISERLGGDIQEVTSSVVQKAAETFLHRFFVKKGRRKREMLELCSIVSMTLTGLLIGIASKDWNSHELILILGLLCFAIGIGTSSFSIMNKL